MEQKTIDKIVENLTMKGNSKITIRNYCYSIKRFSKYHEGKELEKLTEEDVLNYLKVNFINKKLSAETYNHHVSAINFFYALIYNKTFNKFKLPRCKVRKKVPTLISNELIMKIITEEPNLKYKAWLALAYGSGLREIEIATIKIEHIFSKENKIKVLGKFNKERFTVLPDFTVNILRQYYKHKKMLKKYGYLFEGIKNNDYMSSRCIINYFLTIKQKYNLPEDFTFHSLRHSFATNFLKNSNDLMTLKSLLGHSSITSTAIYLHMANDYSNTYSPLGDNNV